MKKADVILKIQIFERALERLKDAIQSAQDDLDKDGVIQRFEFVVELFWKTLKAILEYQGIECHSPRTCIKEAFKAKIIKDDDIVLDMLDDRNLSSHIYNDKISQEIFERIKNVYVRFLHDLNLENIL